MSAIPAEALVKSYLVIEDPASSTFPAQLAALIEAQALTLQKLVALLAEPLVSEEATERARGPLLLIEISVRCDSDIFPRANRRWIAGCCARKVVERQDQSTG